MFSECNGLTSLDVSQLDTSNVTDMSEMFSHCSGLTSLEVSNLDTSKVTDMSRMFSHCSGLTSLDVSQLDTSNVTAMTGMFRLCSGLTSLDVSQLDTSNVTSMGEMFNSCSGLTSLDVSNLDTSNVTSMYQMFRSCSGLTSLDVSNLDTSNVTSMSGMFSGCSKLTSLDVSNLDTSNVTDMSQMFRSCSGLTSLDVSNLNTGKVTDMSRMFNGCSGLTSLDVSNLNTSKVTKMTYMFSECNGLTSLDLSNFDTANVANMAYMFNECRKLTDLNVSNLDTSKVTDMNSMFRVCQELTILDVSNFDTSKVTDMRYMLYSCHKLKTIYASNKFIAPTKSALMFSGCSNLVGGNGTIYNNSYSNNGDYARIDTAETPGYFTEKATQTGAVNANSMNLLTTDNLIYDDTSITISKTNYLQTTYMLAGNTIGEDEDDSTNPITYSTANTNYDDQGNETHWVKDGNIWTYTFYVDDPHATWFVWEEPVAEGYISNYTIDNPGQVENQQAKIVNYKYDDSSSGSSSDDENITIKYGSLAISKTLKDASGNVISSDSDNTEFTVIVNLTAPAGYESLISGTKVFGNYVFKDGTGTIKLRAGQTITIPGIVAGTTYSVSEKGLNGYESSCDSSSGTISNEEASTVTYINTKSYEEQDGSTQPSSKYVDIKIEKVVSGQFEDNDEHKFEITLSNLVAYQTYTIKKYLSTVGTTEIEEFTYVADDTGSANITINLKNEEQVVLKDIPVGSKYKVFEYAGNYISSYSIIDGNDSGLINSTANINTKENRSLSTAIETADEGEDITITFTNKKSVTQNLKLVKEVTDENDKNSYIFEIVFSNMPEGTSFNSSVGKVTADQYGMAELTIYLAGGEEVEFYNIPVGTKYNVTELASTAITSYTIVDNNGLNKIEKISEANSKPKTALSTELETVNQGEEATITFINDTTNIDEEDAQDSVEVTIGVTKIVINENEEVAEDCEDIFAFELKAKDENNPMPDKSTSDDEDELSENQQSNSEASRVVSIKGNGTASFGTIVFTKTGTYVYTITEIVKDSEDYTYDKTTYTVVYEVTNPNGLLEVTKTVTKNGFRGDVITFTNIQRDKTSEDEPSGDSKEPEEENKSEESKESSENKENNKENTNNAQANNVKTGDVIVIYIANIIVVGAILLISIKCRRK